MPAYKRVHSNERGARVIEYGLIGVGISVAIIGVINTIGAYLKLLF